VLSCIIKPIELGKQKACQEISQQAAEN